MPDLEEEASPRNHVSTGPKTQSGKATSSQNSTTHGCTSKKRIIKGESQGEFDELLADWMDDYRPRGKSGRLLVEEAALAQWILRRNTNQYNAACESLEDKNALEWTEEDHKKMERFTRYKTTAERSFTRAANTLEQVLTRRQRRSAARKQAVDEEEEKEAEELMEGLEESGVEEGKNRERELPEIEVGAIHVLDQWVDVEIENGRTVTKLEPATEQLFEDRQMMQPPPEQVRRRFDFRQGIPEEYGWALKSEEQRVRRSWGVQQIRIETWLKAVEREKAAGTGHLSDTGEDLPDPKRRSWCWCPVCERNSEIRHRRRQELEAEGVLK
jgi:hypothetical protein